MNSFTPIELNVPSGERGEYEAKRCAIDIGQLASSFFPNFWGEVNNPKTQNPCWNPNLPIFPNLMKRGTSRIEHANPGAVEWRSRMRGAAFAIILAGHAAIGAEVAPTFLNWEHEVDVHGQTAPLVMQVDWVMQGFDPSYTGFMCEFLGIAEAMKHELPHLSVQQSSWRWNSSNPFQTLLGKAFTKDLFAPEAAAMAHLTSPDAVDMAALQALHPSHVLALPRSKYLPAFQATDQTCGAVGPRQDGAAAEKAGHIHHATFILGGNMTRPLARGVETAAQCCQRCLRDPLCLHWSFGGAAPGDAHCLLRGTASEALVSAPHWTSGTMAGVQMPRQGQSQSQSQAATDPSALAKAPKSALPMPMTRLPPPRAVIFHGTTCIHRNESLYHGNKRDINTILIGRYMVERAAFTHGLDQNEYGVLSCAALVDEIWVPTQWHVEVMRTLLAFASVHGKKIAVVPESVDTSLFDPAKIGPEARARRRVVPGVGGGGSGGGVDEGRDYLESRCSVLSVAAHSDANPNPNPSPAEALVDAAGSSELPGNPSGPFILSSWEAGEGRTARVVCPDRPHRPHGPQLSVPRREEGAPGTAQEAPVTEVRETHKFQFLSIFKWEFRKGWDVLLRAYWRAFSGEDHVTLRLRTYVPPFIQGDTNITAMIADFAAREGFDANSLPEVIWEQGIVTGPRGGAGPEGALSRSDMRDLYATADAFVLPTRGEGWGVPVAEAMAMALPTIITNYSGPTAYATAHNAYLLPVLPDLDANSYAQPNEDVLVTLMRQVVLTLILILTLT